MAEYRNNGPFNLQAKMVTAFTYVPMNRLEEAIGLLADALPQELIGLLDWFEDNYVGRINSSVPEWESSIEDNGQLLYIDCHPHVISQPLPENEQKVQFTKNSQTRKSSRGKFLRLIRRRGSKRRSKRFQKMNDSAQETKVTFQDYNEGEIKKVTIEARKLNGKLITAESMLGINLSSFTDGRRIMIAGFPPESEAKNDKNIKIGDWLKSINNIPVNVDTLDSVLQQLSNTEIKLELQRVTGVEVTKQPPSNELRTCSYFVKELTDKSSPENTDLANLLYEQPIGILYINTADLREDLPEFEEIIYCYPKPFNKNQLALCRGAFITINHLITDITKTEPQIATILVKNRLTHVVFTNFNQKLLLFMIPDNRIDAKEILLLSNEIVRMLKFIFDTLDLCFTTEHTPELNHFFARFFARVLSSGLWNKAEQSVLLRNFMHKVETKGPHQFETLLPIAQFISLPVEAQMQIEDALNELEASDYREWNEDPLDCQRLFTILGSALYHSGYLLASHFAHDDLVDVHVYCKQQGIFHLSRNEPLRSMILWREVYPSSCRANGDFIIPPTARQYLLIVGCRKDLLIVIMEAGGCTEPPENNLPPDAFYVEEVQATLAHLQELGISELAERWINSNPGSQVTIPQVPTVRKKTDFLGTINFNKSISPAKESTPPNKKQPEITSILKRRSSDQGTLAQTNILDEFETYSAEDSISQGGFSERSENSDEPLMSRRIGEETTRFNCSDDDESDIDDYRDGSQISNSSYDLSELRQTLLNETGEIQPPKLTAGKDEVLYHYVQLDFTEGILLSPPDCRINSKTLDLILNNFRSCCQDIHNLFKNTLRFKNMTPHDMAKSVMNKSLIAIKEHGTLFEANYQDEMSKKSTKISYWVIGRLFLMPHPRETYICVEESIPQNLIEIAFNLAIAMGT